MDDRDIGLLRKLSEKHTVSEVKAENIAHLVKDLVAEIQEESKTHRIPGRQKKQLLMQTMRIILSELSYFMFKELISELIDLYVDFARGYIIKKQRLID